MIREKFDFLKDEFRNRPTVDVARLGFDPNMSEENKFRLLRMGYWHGYFFGGNEYESYALRMLPGKSAEAWPVMTTTKGWSAWTVSPTIAEWPALRKCSQMEGLRTFQSYQRNWDQVSEVLQKFYNLFGGSQYHTFLTQHLEDTANHPQSDDEKLAVFLRFWDYLDPSQGHKLLRSLINSSFLNPDTLQNEFVPDGDFGNDFGHWDTRIRKTVGLLHSGLGPLCNRWEINTPRRWDHFVQPHGIDPVTDASQHFHRTSNTEDMSLNGIVESLLIHGANFDFLPIEIRQSPLFAALLSLSNNYKTYIGVQHFEAAVLFDLEHDDPVNAWNSLVSAAYWSGQNMEETMMPAWEAAMQLAEANNWSEIFELLKDQWDWYHEFKRRNNIS